MTRNRAKFSCLEILVRHGCRGAVCKQPRISSVASPCRIYRSWRYVIDNTNGLSRLRDAKITFSPCPSTTLQPHCSVSDRLSRFDDMGVPMYAKLDSLQASGGRPVNTINRGGITEESQGDCRVSRLLLMPSSPVSWSAGGCRFWRVTPDFTATPGFRRLVVLPGAGASSETARASNTPKTVVERPGASRLARGATSDTEDARRHESPFRPWLFWLARSWARETS